MTERFSHRIGKTPSRTALQVDSVDEPLKNSIWNVVYLYYTQTPHFSHFGTLARSLAVDYLKIPVDSLPDSDYRCYQHVNAFYFSGIADWWIFYDFIEVAFSTYHSSIAKRDSTTLRQFSADINKVLELEASAYRLIDGRIVPISNPVEVSAIEDAANCALPGASAHITSALRCLAIMPNPDYRNTIKESISAVESACKVLSGTTTGGLDDALHVLDQKSPLHGALKAAFRSLYGYTSDEKGIRHALLDDSTTPVGYTEAKFMLVACSAFVNYLFDRKRQA